MARRGPENGHSPEEAQVAPPELGRDPEGAPTDTTPLPPLNEIDEAEIPGSLAFTGVEGQASNITIRTLESSDLTGGDLTRLVGSLFRDTKKPLANNPDNRKNLVYLLAALYRIAKTNPSKAKALKTWLKSLTNGKGRTTGNWQKEIVTAKLTEFEALSEEESVITAVDTREAELDRIKQAIRGCLKDSTYKAQNLVRFQVAKGDGRIFFPGQKSKVNAALKTISTKATLVAAILELRDLQDDDADSPILEITVRQDGGVSLNRRKEFYKTGVWLSDGESAPEPDQAEAATGEAFQTTVETAAAEQGPEVLAAVEQQLNALGQEIAALPADEAAKYLKELDVALKSGQPIAEQLSVDNPLRKAVGGPLEEFTKAMIGKVDTDGFGAPEEDKPVSPTLPGPIPRYQKGKHMQRLGVYTGIERTAYLVAVAALLHGIETGIYQMAYTNDWEVNELKVSLGSLALSAGIVYVMDIAKRGVRHVEEQLGGGTRPRADGKQVSVVGAVGAVARYGRKHPIKGVAGLGALFSAAWAASMIGFGQSIVNAERTADFGEHVLEELDPLKTQVEMAGPNIETFLTTVEQIQNFLVAAETNELNARAQYPVISKLFPEGTELTAGPGRGLITVGLESWYSGRKSVTAPMSPLKLRQGEKSESLTERQKQRETDLTAVLDQLDELRTSMYTLESRRLLAADPKTDPKLLKTIGKEQGLAEFVAQEAQPLKDLQTSILGKIAHLGELIQKSKDTTPFEYLAISLAAEPATLGAKAAGAMGWEGAERKLEGFENLGGDPFEIPRLVAEIGKDIKALEILRGELLELAADTFGPKTAKAMEIVSVGDRQKAPMPELELPMDAAAGLDAVLQSFPKSSAGIYLDRDALKTIGGYLERLTVKPPVSEVAYGAAIMYLWFLFYAGAIESNILPLATRAEIRRKHFFEEELSEKLPQLEAVQREVAGKVKAALSGLSGYTAIFLGDEPSPISEATLDDYIVYRLTELAVEAAPAKFDPPKSFKGGKVAWAKQKALQLSVRLQTMVIGGVPREVEEYNEIYLPFLTEWKQRIDKDPSAIDELIEAISPEYAEIRSLALQPLLEPGSAQRMPDGERVTKIRELAVSSRRREVESRVRYLNNLVTAYELVEKELASSDDTLRSSGLAFDIDADAEAISLDQELFSQAHAAAEVRRLVNATRKELGVLRRAGLKTSGRISETRLAQGDENLDFITEIAVPATEDFATGPLAIEVRTLKERISATAKAGVELDQKAFAATQKQLRETIGTFKESVTGKKLLSTGQLDFNLEYDGQQGGLVIKVRYQEGGRTNVAVFNELFPSDKSNEEVTKSFGHWLSRMGKRNFEEVQARNRVTDTAAERTQSLEAELTELGQRLPKKITLSTDTGLDEAAIQSIIRYHKVKLSLGNIKKRQKSGERLLKHELNADTFNPDRINIANLGRLKDILEDLRENLSREELAGYTVSYDVDNNAITVRPSSKVGRGVETLVSGGTLSSGTAQTPARGIRGFFSRLIPRGLRAGRETLQLVATPKAKVTVKLANYRSVDDLIQKLAA